VTARLAIHPDLGARAPDVLDRLLRAGVDVEHVPARGDGCPGGDPLRGVREGHLELAVVGLDTLRGSAAEDLTRVAALPRDDPRDALVSLSGPMAPLRGLPGGARVAVSGARRRAFLRLHRPDVEIVEALGRTGHEARVAAAVMASWEARRAGHAARIAEVLDVRSWLPAPGPGIVALLARHPLAEVTALDHLPTRTALRAELGLVDALDFGPDVADGAVAQPSGRLLRLWAAVLSADGRRLVRSDVTGPLDEPEVLGVAVARQLMRRGAGLVLAGALP
jgi:hydroxymethylbilane synthase